MANLGIILSSITSIISLLTLLISRYKLPNKKEIDKEYLQQVYQATIVKNASKTFLKVTTRVDILGVNKIAENVSIIVNGASISKLMKEYNKFQGREGVYKKAVISTLFLKKKLKKIYKTYLVLGVGSIITLIYNLYVGDTLLLSSIVFGSIIFVTIYQLVAIFRVKNGLFGSNLYEAKELIEFLEKNSDKFDDNGNGLFNEEKFAEYIVALKRAKKQGVEYKVEY